jgi:hypothetical protein
MARAIFVQNLQSASKKSQPRAWREDLESVYSLAREIMCTSVKQVAAEAGLYDDEKQAGRGKKRTGRNSCAT